MKRIIVTILLFCAYVNSYAQFKVVAYLPKYTSTLADHINAFDFTKVTHINIAFFNPDANGNFHSSQGTGLDQIVTKAHLNNVKVLLSIGGGSLRPNYANLLKDENRAAFVTKVVALVSLYGVDGIDIDLEGDNIDENYGSFITDLSAQLKPSGKLLTAAVAWWTRARISDAALEAFDFINVMAYDKAGASHSPYDYATQHMGYWKGVRGLPASKIIVGVPFYGWYIQDGALKEMNYKTLIAQYPGAENKDTITRTDGFMVNYNGIPTIKNKTAFSLGEGGGIMFWQVLQDQPGPLSLLSAIHEKMNINAGWKDPYITWKYDLGTLTGNAETSFNSTTTDRISVATVGTPGFLPYPPYGYGRVFLPANSGGAFELQGTGNNTKLKVNAASTGAPGKFSWYNINEATSVATIKFNLGLNAALTNGQVIIPFGYSTNTSSTFNNTGQLTSTNTPGVFGALRLDFYGGNFATLSHRNTSYGYSVINNNVFNKTGNYQVEIYCNNDSINRIYTKGTVNYTLAPQKYNIWVNGVLMQDASSIISFPSTGELAEKGVINSFSINTSGNTGTPTSVPPTGANSLLATLSDISVDYAFKTNFYSSMPVHLKFFNGKKEGNTAHLNWATVSEKKNSHFEILKSTNGTDFKLLGTVKGGINSNDKRDYSFVDFNSPSGENYYKLRQVDTDGNYEDFGILSLTFHMGKSKGFSAYITSGSQLVFNYQSDKIAKADLVILDIAGRVMSKENIQLNQGYNHSEVDVSFLSPGVYVLSLADNATVSTCKFIKN